MDLKKAADIAIDTCMAVKPNETVLIITDKLREGIAHALYDAALDTTKNVFMVEIPVTSRDGEEPPHLAAYAALKADVILAPTTFSITHTLAMKNARRKGARIATMPRINEDMFKRTIDIDYVAMKKTIEGIDAVLSKASRVKITSQSGTNIVIDVEGRKTVQDTGLYTKPGMFGNLPAGEVELAPREKKSSGVIVIDHMGDICKPKTKLYMHNGVVQEVEGDDAFRRQLWHYKNARRIAELGIGTNPNAVLTGNILEDEKILGTCHIAVGSNFTYPGGKTHAEVHWDAIIIKPTIFFDDRKVMDGGDLLI
jgi:leucyl aminopeptidase (aminopeptidase T)